MYYDIRLREGPVEVGLFVHDRCFMYRIGPAFYASCEYENNRYSTPQMVYIKRIFNSVFVELQLPLWSCFFLLNRSSELTALHRELSRAIIMLMIIMCVALPAVLSWRNCLPCVTSLIPRPHINWFLTGYLTLQKKCKLSIFDHHLPLTTR